MSFLPWWSFGFPFCLHGFAQPSPSQTLPWLKAKGTHPPRAYSLLSDYILVIQDPEFPAQTLVSM
jgi:hypothetical protein